MALASRTLADYVKAFRHVAPGWDDDAMDPVDVVNDAFLEFATEAEWSWLQTSSSSLAFVANQSHVDLPEDFNSIVSVTHPQTGLWPVYVTSIAHIMRLRASYVQVDVSYFSYFALGGYSPTTPGRRVLEMWPTPTANAPNALTLYYRKGPALLEEPEDVPVMPRECESALIHKVRAKAYELADNNFQSSDHVAYQQKLLDLKYKFGMENIDRGRMVPGTGASPFTLTPYPGEVIVPDISP